MQRHPFISRRDPLSRTGSLATGGLAVSGAASSALGVTGTAQDSVSVAQCLLDASTPFRIRGRVGWCRFCDLLVFVTPALLLRISFLIPPAPFPPEAWGRRGATLDIVSALTREGVRGSGGSLSSRG